MSAGIQPLFLSPRQTDVLTLAAADCTERETALRLGIASATVRGDELAHALGWPAGILRDYDPERVNWREVSPWGYGWRHPRRMTPWP